MTLARHEAHDLWRQSRGLTQIFGSRRFLTLAERCLSIRHQDPTREARLRRVCRLSVDFVSAKKRHEIGRLFETYWGGREPPTDHA